MAIAIISPKTGPLIHFKGNRPVIMIVNRAQTMLMLTCSALSRCKSPDNVIDCSNIFHQRLRSKNRPVIKTFLKAVNNNQSGEIQTLTL